jgi:hypothetical protein
MQQPPNSPDINVLDLCFFRSLESLTDNHAPTTIKELIDNVEEEYNNYDIDKLACSLVTLQSCMIEVMKEGGGIGYSIPHMGKEQLRAEGRLPLALCITADLLAKTKALIEKGKLVTRVNSANVLDEGLRIGEIGRRMNSKVKLVEIGVYRK